MEQDTCFCSVLPVVGEADEASILVGVLSCDGRKSLRCLGGHAQTGEAPVRCALRNLQDAVFGLLGTNAAVSRSLTRSNRAKTSHGFAWILPLNPRSKELVVEQQASVSNYLKSRLNVKTQFQRVCWVSMQSVLRPKKGAPRSSPQLVEAARALSCHPRLRHENA